MKSLCITLSAAVLIPVSVRAMDNEQESVLGALQLDEFPLEVISNICNQLTPKSNGDAFKYTQEQHNKFITTFAAVRRVCKNFYSAMNIAFTHAEWSNIYYAKLCTYGSLNTEWLYLVAQGVGPKIQCPSSLLSDWATAKNKKFPDNKIPCEYFLAQLIKDAKSDDVALSAVKMLVAAGTKVTFSGIEVDEWLMSCIAGNTPLHNAIDREFRKVVTFLVSRGAFIKEADHMFAQLLHPQMCGLLTQLDEKYPDKDASSEGWCTLS